MVAQQVIVSEHFHLAHSSAPWPIETLNAIHFYQQKSFELKLF
jgi:hypothetical protein